MDEAALNMSLRKFLKQLGVTGQQEIEKAIRAAEAAGTLPAGPIKATAVITLEGVELTHEVTGEIATKG